MSTLSAVLPVGFDGMEKLRWPAWFPDPVVESWTEEDGLAVVITARFGGNLVCARRLVDAPFDGADYGVRIRYRTDGGLSVPDSPWKLGETVRVTDWLLSLHVDLSVTYRLLMQETATAASWYVQGFPFYPGNPELTGFESLTQAVVIDAVNPLPLGEWPGTGRADVVHGHDDGMQLLWLPDGEQPGTVLGDVHTLADGAVAARPRTGIDWADVGTREEDAVEWMATAYRNHLLIHQVERQLLTAVVRRLAGLA